MRVLIVGCGYVGTAAGALLADRGHRVFGLNRSSSDQEALRGLGIEPLVGDLTRSEDLSALPGPFDWVVNAVSSSRGDASVYRKVYVEGNRNLVAWLATQDVKRVLFTSSSSVYGQIDGSTVDEQSPTEPNSETARIVLEAERVFLDAYQNQGFPVSILRLSGIYGPGRGFLFHQFLKGDARLPKDEKRFINMIHRDDIARAVVAALEKGEPGAIYNVTDDEAVTQRVFFQWMAERTGLPMPPESDESRPTNRKRALTRKRVSNRRLRQELGVRLEYPTFREGYAPELRRLGYSGG